MNHPNLSLMRNYGTAGVFFEKVAGGSPFAARVAAAVFSGAMMHAAGTEMDRQKMEAHQLNEQFRLAEQRLMGPIDRGLQHTQAPMFIQAGSDLPVGWDEGMVRLASIARGAGEDMAKTAVMSPTRLIGNLAPRPRPAPMPAAAPGALAGAAATPKLQPSPVPKVTEPAAGAAVSKGSGMMEGLLGKSWKAKALGYGALAGGGYLGLKGLNKGLGWMNRPAPEQSWGAPETQLPMGVNSYGQPQLGTPLMG